MCGLDALGKRFSEALQLRPISGEDYPFRLGEESVDHLDEVTRLDPSVGVTVGEAEKIEGAYKVQQTGKCLAGSESPMHGQRRISHEPPPANDQSYSIRSSFPHRLAPERPR
jgi:hypothetical protein